MSASALRDRVALLQGLLGHHLDALQHLRAGRKVGARVVRRARHRFRGRQGAGPALVDATGLRFEARGHSERSDFVCVCLCVSADF